MHRQGDTIKSAVIEPTPTETEAVRLRYRAIRPDAPVDAEPTQEQFDDLLMDVRKRASAIEVAALHMMMDKMKVKKTTNFEARHGQQAVVLAFIAVVIAFGVFVALKVMKFVP
jgi:hypothetical protein